MIEQRIYTTEDGRELIKSESDRGMKIRQIETGILYDVAIDVPDLYTYEETNIPIDKPDPETIRSEYEEAGHIMLGEED